MRESCEPFPHAVLGIGLGKRCRSTHSEDPSDMQRGGVKYPASLHHAVLDSAALLALDLDRPRLALLGLRQRECQHTILEDSLGLVGLHWYVEREGP